MFHEMTLKLYFMKCLERKISVYPSLKTIWCCSFHGYRNFARETFLGGEHLTGSSTKTASRINFKLCTHISNRLLHKTVPAFFLLVQELRHIEKVVSFGPNLTLILPIFGEHKKGKLNVLKKVGLSTFREIS